MKKIDIFFKLLMVFLLSSCVHDTSILPDMDLAENEKVEISFSLDFSDDFAETTRTSDFLTEPYVLVFNSDGVLKNFEKPIHKEGGLFSVNVSPTAGKVEDKLVVVLNSDLTEFPKRGQKYDEVKQMFSFSSPVVVQNENSLPKWGEVLTFITKESEPIKVMMKYSVLQLQLDIKDSNFTYESFYLYNYNTKGYTSIGKPLDENSEDTPECASNYELNVFDSKASKALEFLNTQNIYLSEVENLTKDDSAVFLVIKGKYNKDKKSSYYPIYFLDNNLNSFSLQRGYKYQIGVEMFLGTGFSTLKAAETADPSNFSDLMDYKIIEWDDAITEMWRDKDSYLGMATSLVSLEVGDNYFIPCQMSKDIETSFGVSWLNKDNNPFVFEINKDKNGGIIGITVSLPRFNPTNLQENIIQIKALGKLFTTIPVVKESSMFNILSLNVDLSGRYVEGKPIQKNDYDYYVYEEMEELNNFKLKAEKNAIKLNLIYTNLTKDREITLKSNVKAGIYFEGTVILKKGSDRADVTLECKEIEEGKGPTNSGEYEFVFDLSEETANSSMGEIIVSVPIQAFNEYRNTKILLVDNSLKGYSENNLSTLLKNSWVFGPNSVLTKMKNFEVTVSNSLNLHTLDNFHIIFYRAGTPILQTSKEDPDKYQKIKEFMDKGGFFIDCYDGFWGDATKVTNSWPNQWEEELATATITLFNGKKYRVQKELSLCERLSKRYSDDGYLKDIKVGLPHDIGFIVSESSLNYKREYYKNTDDAFDYHIRAYFGEQTVDKDYIIKSSFYYTLPKDGKMYSLLTGQRAGVTIKKGITTYTVVLPRTDQLLAGLDKYLGYIWIGAPLIFDDENLKKHEGIPVLPSFSDSLFTYGMIDFAIRWVDAYYKDFNALNKHVEITNNGVKILYN